MLTKFELAVSLHARLAPYIPAKCHQESFEVLKAALSDFAILVVTDNDILSEAETHTPEIKYLDRYNTETKDALKLAKTYIEDVISNEIDEFICAAIAWVGEDIEEKKKHATNSV